MRKCESPSSPQLHNYQDEAQLGDDNQVEQTKLSDYNMNRTYSDDKPSSVKDGR